MTYSKIRLYALSLTVFLMMYILISYLVVMGSYHAIYTLSPNYVALQNSGRITTPWESIIEFNKESNVVVIAEYDEGVIGFYDPSFRFAFQNTAHMVGKTRYLGIDDYINKTKAGIIFSDKLAKDFKACQASQSPYFDELLYCSDTMSAYGNEGSTNYALNLTAMDTLGERIYVDSINASDEEFSHIVGKLKQLGYDEFDRGFTFHKFLDAFDDRSSVISWMIILLLVFGAILYIASYWHYIYLLPILRVHHKVGGSKMQIFIYQLREFPIFIAVGLGIVSLYHHIRHQLFSILNAEIPIILLFLLYVVLFIIIQYLSFSSVFNHRAKKVRV